MRRLLCGAFVAGVLALAPAAVAAPIGLQSVEVSATEAPPAVHGLNQLGPEDTQAGSHPYALTTSFQLSKPEEFVEGRSDDFRMPGGGLKDFELELPPGLVGNPNATPKCTYKDFKNDECPNDTAVGTATTKLLKGVEGYENLAGEDVDRYITRTEPVYNLEPPGGIPAEFGFKVVRNIPVFVDASVRTGGDYGLTTSIRDIPQSAPILGGTVNIWGVPGDPSHNRFRGECLGPTERNSKEVEDGDETPPNYEASRREEEEEEGITDPRAPVECPADTLVQPLLTNPTSCGESRTATASVDSWKEPGMFASMAVTLPALAGCEHLDFSPTLTVTPDGTAGSTPTGLNVDVHVPQESTTNPLGLGEADVKDTTVTLPVGVQLSPSAADGLQACSSAQIGFKRVNPVTGIDEFEPKLYNVETQKDEATLCPDASKVASVRIKTPLLEGELMGSVYLAAPQNFMGIPENPFSSLVAMYLVAEEPETGVLVKVAGKVEPNPETGQLTATFENTPQLPYSDLKLEFYGSARAPLATPALCGTYTTTSSFTPWSAPESGPPATPSSRFQITSGPATVSEPNGAPCPGATLPFSPTLQSGTTNINAGSFTPLTTTLSREDGQQNIQQVTLHYPPGLSGILSGVKLCAEAEANAGTCGPESLIGETIVSVGLGNDPFTVTGGKVYLTGPYEGAPFGLSIVNPAKAGPFDLQEGRPVVVRAKVEVDPHTAALTVTTNTAAQGYAIPSIIEGIPLQIKHVNVNITRPGFTLNPTGCNPTQITGTVASAEGASSEVEIPFQVTNCASLKFTPRFEVSTSGKTSKADGASLTARVQEPSGALGTQANISYVKVELPKALPSRLSTLQKACPSAQFALDPAGCPAASDIGHAVVHTPLLPVPLEGPAIFVSHGGEEFPSLTIVLQGYGVTVDLVGTTFISKAGITSTTFKAVPDTPFNSFELTLPEGPYSALTANVDLCQQKLVMPVAFVAQNSATLNEIASIKVEGCSTTLALIAKALAKNTLKLSVAVPSSGKLIAGGVGLSKATKSANGRETITVTLKVEPTKTQATLLAHHHGRKLVDHVKLTFKLASGKKLTKTFSVAV
jgi:hypothetical protein